MTDEKNGERLERVEQHFNRLDADNLKCSLRVFGIPDNETVNSQLTNVINANLISVCNEDDNLSESDMKSARCICEMNIRSLE